MPFYKSFQSHKIVCQLYFFSTRSGISLKVKTIIYKEITLSTHSISFISSVLETLDGFKIVFPHLAHVLCSSCLDVIPVTIWFFSFPHQSWYKAWFLAKWLWHALFLRIVIWPYVSSVCLLDYGLEFNPDFTLSNAIQRICRTPIEKWSTGQWSTRKDQGQKNIYKSSLLIVKFILLFNPGLCAIRESLHLDYCFISKISTELPWHYVLNVLYYWVM